MATIIKQSSEHYPTALRLSAMALDMVDVEGQADQYIEQVQVKAREIVQQAQAEADSIRKQSEEAGRKAAEAAIDRILEEKVAKQMETLAPALRSAVNQILEARQDWQRTWEARTLQLASAIAERIVRREVQAAPEIPLTWIVESLELCSGSAEITVRLNPQEHSTLGGQVAQLAEEFSPAASAKVVSDPNISVGGCKIETEFGTVDTQIEAQIARLVQEME